jgi:phosphopantetheinyl transferase
MHTAEQVLVDRLETGRSHGALRVWSAKEAAAKALGIDLAQAWQRIRISDIAADASRLQDRQSGRIWVARHAAWHDHLFTLLVLDGES